MGILLAVEVGGINSGEQKLLNIFIKWHGLEFFFHFYHRDPLIPCNLD